MGIPQEAELTSKRHTAPLRGRPKEQHLPVSSLVPRLEGKRRTGVQKGLPGCLQHKLQRQARTRCMASQLCLQAKMFLSWPVPPKTLQPSRLRLFSVPPFSCITAQMLRKLSHLPLLAILPRSRSQAQVLHRLFHLRLLVAMA